MNPPTVLVVDDESDVLVYLFDLLSHEGFRVATTPSPHDALAMAASLPPDVVVADYRMPGMDGVEFVKQLRRIIPTVRVLLLSAYADWPMYFEAMNEGAIDVLQKPCPREDLVRVIRRALAKKEAG